MIGEHDCGLMNPCAKGHIMRIRRGGERTCYGGGVIYPSGSAYQVPQLPFLPWPHFARFLQ